MMLRHELEFRMAARGKQDSVIIREYCSLKSIMVRLEDSAL
jgi:hypothetical protein